MGNLQENLRSLVDTSIERSLDLYQNVPAVMFLLLILAGLVYLFFGLKIYKVILGVLCFVIGGTAAYQFTDNMVICAAVGAGLALVAIILQFLFMLVVAGITFGAVAFAGMTIYFQFHVSFLAGVAMAIVGIYAAIKVFRFIVILTTSAIGSAAVTFSVLVLRDNEGILGKIDLTETVVDEFQMAVGFAGLLLVGVIVQGITWGRSKDDDKKP